MFGKNYGIEHSPHIAAQMNLDHKIFLGLIAGTILLAVGDQKRNGSFMTLRGNARQVQYGRFEADDFVKKNWFCLQELQSVLYFTYDEIGEKTFIFKTKTANLGT